MGLMYPVKLLKLEMDFCNRTLRFINLFENSFGVFQGAHLDLVIGYAFKREIAIL